MDTKNKLKKIKKALDSYYILALYSDMKNKENIMKTKQLNLWPGGYKKQKWNRGNPLTKKDKLYRISTFDYIRGNGGTLRDVALAWGISPNNGKVGWMVQWYKKELGIK